MVKSLVTLVPSSILHTKFSLVRSLLQRNTEEFRKGYGKQTWDAAWKSLDRDYTIGLIAVTHMILRYEKLGFHTVWSTFVAIKSGCADCRQDACRS